MNQDLKYEFGFKREVWAAGINLEFISIKTFPGDYIESPMW